MDETDSKTSKFICPKTNWTFEDKMKLIKLVEKFPVLWDNTCKFYRNSQKRKTALEAIELELNNKFNISHINSQWLYLRDSFFKRHSDIRLMASLMVTKSNSCWKFYEPLKYLLRSVGVYEEKLRRQYSGYVEASNLENKRRARMAHLQMLRARELIQTTFRTQRKTLIVANKTSTSLDVFSPDIKEEDLTQGNNLIGESLQNYKIALKKPRNNGYILHPIVNLRNTNLSNNCSKSMSYEKETATESKNASTDDLFDDVSLEIESNLEKIPCMDMEEENSEKTISPFEFQTTFNDEVQKPHLNYTQRKRNRLGMFTGKNKKAIFKLLRAINEQKKSTAILTNTSPTTSKNCLVSEESLQAKVKSEATTEQLYETNLSEISSNSVTLVDCEKDSETNLEKYKFKFLGSYVETSLLNIYYQNPKLARNLVRLMYATIKKHNELLQITTA